MEVVLDGGYPLGAGVKLGEKLEAENTESAGSGSHSSGMVKARMLSFGTHVVPGGTYVGWGQRGSWVRTGSRGANLVSLRFLWGWALI